MRSSGRSCRAGTGLFQPARAVALLAPVLALGCAGASSSARPAEDDRCAQRAAAETPLPSEAWTLKLDPNVSSRLREWRADAAYARCAGTDRRVAEDADLSVDVEYSGDLGALRTAGLETGLDRDGTVSGIISMRDLEALARVPGVVAIRGEGHPEPETGGE